MGDLIPEDENTPITNMFSAYSKISQIASMIEGQNHIVAQIPEIKESTNRAVNEALESRRSAENACKEVEIAKTAIAGLDRRLESLEDRHQKAMDKISKSQWRTAFAMISAAVAITLALFGGAWKLSHTMGSLEEGIESRAREIESIKEEARRYRKAAEPVPPLRPEFRGGR